jgi:uncharacterized protein (DUF362 family)
MSERVAIYKLKDAAYPKGNCLFAPSETYPEYLFQENISKDCNEVYQGVRDLFRLLGMDKARFDTPEWNPFFGKIHPGDTVVLKPNMVQHYSNDGKSGIETLVTHGSIIRAMLDYVFIAVGKSGKVLVCDSPHGMADFEQIIEFMQLPEMVQFYAAQGFELNVFDLRRIKFHSIFGKEVHFYHSMLDGDPNGYVTVALNGASFLQNIGIPWECLTGASLNRSELHKHHSDNLHEYFVSKTVLNADFFISLPKMKTHKKCGVTLNLKNLVGINGNKNYLPHFATYLGEPKTWLQKTFLSIRMFMSDTLLGTWGKRNLFTAYVCLTVYICYGALANTFTVFYKGIQFWRDKPSSPTGTRSNTSDTPENDITWRMVLDLNCILQYAMKDGRLEKHRQRSFFSIIDGVIAGEKQGPLSPTRKDAGVLIAGDDMPLTDGVATMLMGFDPLKLKLMREAIGQREYPLSDYEKYDDVVTVSNCQAYSDIASLKTNNLDFEPPIGWEHIKLS